MNITLSQREKGYNKAMEDIKTMGIEYAKNIFELRKECSGVDTWFTIGYGEAIGESK